MILKEVMDYNPVLMEKPRISVLTKADLVSSGEDPADWDDGPPLVVSAQSGVGLPELERRIWNLLDPKPSEN